VIKTARLASSITLGVLFLAGMAFAQTTLEFRAETGAPERRSLRC